MASDMLLARCMQDALGNDIKFYITSKNEVQIESTGGGVVLDAAARDEFVRLFMAVESFAEERSQAVTR